MKHYLTIRENSSRSLPLIGVGRVRAAGLARPQRWRLRRGRSRSGRDRHLVGADPRSRPQPDSARRDRAAWLDRAGRAGTGLSVWTGLSLLWSDAAARPGRSSAAWRPTPACSRSASACAATPSPRDRSSPGLERCARAARARRALLTPGARAGSRATRPTSSRRRTAQLSDRLLERARGALCVMTLPLLLAAATLARRPARPRAAARAAPGPASDRLPHLLALGESSSRRSPSLSSSASRPIGCGRWPTLASAPRAAWS